MEKNQLADLWKFPWPVMDVLIGGKSSIDLPELRVSTWERANEFILSYGFDPNLPRDQRRMHAIIIEAIAFIESQLLTKREWDRGIRPPDEILLCHDVCELLMMASSKSPGDRLQRTWACAVLRVIHTIAHIEGVNRYVNIESARDQVMGRIQKYVHRDAEKRLWLGEGDERVELEKVEWKHRKSRNSIILKLLHKRDNVAETIYDYLGVRFVTKQLCDVMLVVKCLWRFHMVSYPNCYPSRSRNNLLDVERFRSQIETLHEMLTAGAISPEEFQQMTARLTAPSTLAATTNPHSAQSYRSIQMTGRQLIRLKNPQFEWLDKMKASLRHSSAVDSDFPGRQQLEEITKLIEGWHSVKGDLEIKAFFPFEVQILDAESYSKIVAGDAAHDRYKLSQVRAARKRILQKVLELSKAPA